MRLLLPFVWWVSAEKSFFRTVLQNMKPCKKMDVPQFFLSFAHWKWLWSAFLRTLNGLKDTYYNNLWFFDIFDSFPWCLERMPVIVIVRKNKRLSTAWFSTHQIHSPTLNSFSACPFECPWAPACPAHLDSLVEALSVHVHVLHVHVWHCDTCGSHNSWTTKSSKKLKWKM